MACWCPSSGGVMLALPLTVYAESPSISACGDWWGGRSVGTPKWQEWTTDRSEIDDVAVCPYHVAAAPVTAVVIRNTFEMRDSAPRWQVRRIAATSQEQGSPRKSSTRPETSALAQRQAFANQLL